MKYAIEDFLRVGDDPDDWSTAFARAIATVQSGSFGGVTIALQNRTYKLKQTINIIRRVAIVGDDSMPVVSSGSDSFEVPRLLWTTDCVGIEVHYPNTHPDVITGASSASPIQITCASHGYVTGDHIHIQNVLGNTAANGYWTITNTGANTFTLDSSTWVSGAYTSGGTFGPAGSYTTDPTSDPRLFTIRNVILEGTGKATGLGYHAIKSRRTIILDNVTVRNWGGDALRLYADSRGDRTNGTGRFAGSLGNTNACQVRGMNIRQVGGYGIVTGAGDANASVFWGPSADDCGYGYSLLTATSTGVSVSSNVATATFVSHPFQVGDCIKSAGCTTDTTGAQITATTATTITYVLSATNGALADGVGTFTGLAIQYFESPLIGNLWIAPLTGATFNGGIGIKANSGKSLFLWLYAEGSSGALHQIEAPAQVVGGAYVPSGPSIFAGTYDWQVSPGMQFSNNFTTGSVFTGGTASADLIDTAWEITNPNDTGTNRWQWEKSQTQTWEYVVQNVAAQIAYAVTARNNKREGIAKFSLPQGLLFSDTTNSKGALLPFKNGSVETWLESRGGRVTVSNATNATPIVVTTGAAHGLVSGQRVEIRNVGGNANANGKFKITVTDGTHFSLQDSAGTNIAGSGTYTSSTGLVIAECATGFFSTAPADGTWFVGDRVWNTTPTATSPAYWLCTASGVPGTWSEGPRNNATVQTTGSVEHANLEIKRVAFAALTTGTADDITIFNANCPGAIRILRYELWISTAVSASTADLRTAAAGGGSLVFESNDSGTTGLKQPLTSTATATVANNGSLYLRRSDRAIAGEIILYCVRT